MKPTILHIDDNHSQYELLHEKLKDRFNILSCSSPDLAIDQLKTIEVDAIISATDLPIIDGFKFHEMLKDNQLAHIPFFFLSNDITDTSRINELNLGADSFFTLSMSSEEMYFRITNRINESALVLNKLK